MKLVIAPHIDDEVIGCGGILDKDTLVAYCGVDSFHVVSDEDRVKEAFTISKMTKHTFRPPREEYRVNHYQDSFNELVDDFENLIQIYSPGEVYIPWPSYNQDHQTVYRAAMVALRPHDKIPLVKKVLLYEEPDCFWPGMGEPFKPNCFREVQIERKLTLYRAMSSQVRGHRSEEHLKALARVRGAAIMVDYAEAYHILRWVE